MRQLLTHTSGIKDDTTIPNFEVLERSPISLPKLVSTLAKYPLEFRPGDKFNYSNTGYYLLGHVIEKISGETYPKFLREKIFIPLGMNSTCVNDLKTVITNRASGYVWKNGRLQNADYSDMSWAYASGALVSTVMDLAKWDAALSTEKLLPKAALEQMWTPAKLNDGSPTHYGFGWYIEDYKGHRLLQHPGGISGFNSYVGRWEGDRITLITLLNRDGRGIGKMVRGIARRYIPSLIAKPTADTDPAATAKVKAVLTAALAGRLDPALLSEKLRADFFPNQAQELSSEFKDSGPVKSLLLLGKNDIEKSREYSYRVVFSKETALLHVTLDERGELSDFDMAME